MAPPDPHQENSNLKAQVKSLQDLASRYAMRLTEVLDRLEDGLLPSIGKRPQLTLIFEDFLRDWSPERLTGGGMCADNRSGLSKKMREDLNLLVDLAYRYGEDPKAAKDAWHQEAMAKKSQAVS